MTIPAYLRRPAIYAQHLKWHRRADRSWVQRTCGVFGVSFSKPSCLISHVLALQCDLTSPLHTLFVIHLVYRNLRERISSRIFAKNLAAQRGIGSQRIKRSLTQGTATQLSHSCYGRRAALRTPEQQHTTFSALLDCGVHISGLN